MVFFRHSVFILQPRRLLRSASPGPSAVKNSPGWPFFPLPNHPISDSVQMYPSVTCPSSRHIDTQTPSRPAWGTVMFQSRRQGLVFFSLFTQTSLLPCSASHSQNSVRRTKSVPPGVSHRFHSGRLCQRIPREKPISRPPHRHPYKERAAKTHLLTDPRLAQARRQMRKSHRPKPRFPRRIFTFSLHHLHLDFCKHIKRSAHRPKSAISNLSSAISNRRLSHVYVPRRN